MSAATQPDAVPEHRQHDGSIAPDVDLKGGRRKVARSRGALSGILLLILGAWAALAPFIGPYFNFGIEPRSDDAWHWTSGRGLYEVLPGGVTALAGIVLLVSASRVLTVLMAWLAALAGVWLVVGSTLDLIFDVGTGSPPQDAGTNKAVALSLLYFLGTGAVIVLVAGIALGRLSVHSVRDVRAAERRAEADAVAETQRLEAERREHARLESERREHERLEGERREHERLESERGHHGDRIDHVRDVDDQQHGDPDRRTSALPVADGPHDVTTDARTAAHPTTNDSYATPAAGPYEPTGNRDAAGSAGYVGHQSMGQPTGQPPVQQEPAGGAHVEGAPMAAPGEPVADPAAAPTPGGMEQYRYPAEETQPPPPPPPPPADDRGTNRPPG